MAPGVLVCPGTWKLRTRKGWALGNVIKGPCGHCEKRFAGPTESRAYREMGKFSAGKPREVGSDKMPSPYQCILSEPDVLLEGWICLLLSLIHLLNPDAGLSRTEPWACVPVEQRAK